MGSFEIAHGFRGAPCGFVGLDDSRGIDRQLSVHIAVTGVTIERNVNEKKEERREEAKCEMEIGVDVGAGACAET